MLSAFQVSTKRSNCSRGTGNVRFGCGFGGKGGKSVLTLRKTRPSWIDIGSSARSSIGYLIAFARDSGALRSFGASVPPPGVEVRGALAPSAAANGESEVSPLRTQTG